LARFSGETGFGAIKITQCRTPAQSSWKSSTFFVYDPNKSTLTSSNKSTITSPRVLLIDRDEGSLEVKEAEANEQHKNIIGALKAAAPE